MICQGTISCMSGGSGMSGNNFWSGTIEIDGM